MSIGKLFITAGTILSVVFPQFAAEGAFLVELGTALVNGGGTVGPVRFGNEGITATIAPWKT